MIGTKLSHYNIVEKLGSGGMGDVYVAEDMELGRKVALKVLPSEMAGSEERRARFKREARSIAALNHPNIVTVHSVEHAAGVHFMTMELVHGKRISELRPKQGFALGKFLEIAIPIADAVAAAHQEGITHRDLKPDNVMLSDDGRVKVLDFGLAKPKAGLASGANNSALPTEDMTEEGRILGTISYMSPEQAEGKPVDERSDIFSLGILFYEMLTGERPFGGDTPASTLSAIIKDTPTFASEIVPSVPRDLAKLLKRCLVKDPARRIQTCVDVRNELEELESALSSGELQPEATTLAVPTRSWVYASAAVALIVGALVWFFTSPRDSRVPRLTRPVQVTSTLAVEQDPAWSPAGDRIAYQSGQAGNWDIWVSQTRGGSAVNLTEDHTGRDDNPSWSPDGSRIAFRSSRDGGGCFVMAAIGGTPARVALQRSFGRPVWSPDGSKLACPSVDGQNRPYVDIVTLASREVERLPLPGEFAHDLSWSPDGRALAYVDAVDVTADVTQLLVVILSGESIALTDGPSAAWSPAWAPDVSSLFYVSNRGGSQDVWMQPLQDDLSPIGDPERVTSGLGIQSISLLSDGTKLAYSKGGRFANVWRVPILPSRPATWSDAEQITFDQAYIEFLALSPDGGRLVVNSNRNGFVDLWTLPAAGGEMRPLTSDPAPDWMASWSPDGKEIVFYTGRTGNRDLFVMPSDGGPMRQLTTNPGDDMHPAWSPDGERIAYTAIDDGNDDIWVVNVTGGEPERLTDFLGEDNKATWSPDGRWIAYFSRADGGRDLWRVPAEGGEPERLTEGYGRLPRWAPDGERIYFRKPNEYWELRLADCTERLVADLSGEAGSQGLNAFATDGEYLYFAWEESLGDIWVMDVVWDE